MEYKPTRFMKPDCHYDKGLADFAVMFIECLCHTKGKWEGKPFKLMPWQEQIVRDIFGVVDDKGLRQFRTAYIEIPKKQGKSEIAAAIALFLLFADGEASPEVYGAAADRNQASIVFDVAKRMVELTPSLGKRCKILAANKRLRERDGSGFYQVLSADVGCLMPYTMLTKTDGSFVRADELKIGDEIFGFNDGVVPTKITSIKWQSPDLIYRIKTHRGREIDVTWNHPFWTMKEGRRPQDLTHEYHWVNAEDLKIGSRVAIGLGECTKPTENENTLEAWALGAWAGDGDCTHFRFINPDDEVVQKLKSFFNSIGCDLVSKFSTRQLRGENKSDYPYEHCIKGNGKRRKCSGREWIRSEYGQKCKAGTKKVPDKIFKGSREMWAAFLAGYLDTDGYLPNNKETIDFTSLSHELIHGCRELFTRLGINACVTYQVNGRYAKLTVAGKQQVAKAYELIYPYMALSRKKERLKERAELKQFIDYKAHFSDKVVSIEPIGKYETVSIEVDGNHTHITNGIVTHNSKHGLNVSGLVLDEVHAQPNRKLYDVLTKGSGDAREQPLYFLITTAGSDKNSICYELHQKAQDILKGKKNDPTFYPVIYGLEKEDDWHDEKNWYKANPSLGTTISIERVRDAYQDALQNPAEENVFKQLRLNMWVDSLTTWMPMDKWKDCSFDVDEEALEGRVCYGGLDLSSTTDITAFVLVFPPLDEEDKFYILPYFWIPEENVDFRVRRDHVPYDIWERQGYLQTTEGNVVHYGYIEKFIEKLGERFYIRDIAYDRWGAVQMVQNLENLGFTVVPMGQGFSSLSPCTKELMKLTLEKRIAHGGHPILTWMMDNVIVRTDPAGNIKMDKSKSTEKIDGAVATVMALDRAIRCGNNTSESIYDDDGARPEGLLFL